jgi:hypothetical protein
VLLFLEVLRGELGLAYNAKGTSCFLEAEKGMGRRRDSIERVDYGDAIASISKAISLVTKRGSKAMRFLVDNGFL